MSTVCGPGRRHGPEFGWGASAIGDVTGNRDGKRSTGTSVIRQEMVVLSLVVWWDDMTRAEGKDG